MQIQGKLQTDHFDYAGEFVDPRPPWETNYSQKKSPTDPGSLIFDGHFSDAFFLDDCVEVDFARRRTVQARTGTEAFAERGWDEEVVRLALESLRVQIIA